MTTDSSFKGGKSICTLRTSIAHHTVTHKAVKHRAHDLHTSTNDYILFLIEKDLKDAQTDQEGDEEENSAILRSSGSRQGSESPCLKIAETP